MKSGTRESLKLACQQLEQRDAPAVTPIGPEFRINVNTNVAVAVPAVAVNSTGGFVATWEADNIDGSNLAVLARRYSSAGVPIGNDFQVNTFTTGSQQNPAIATDSSGNFVVVWGSASVQDGSREGVYLRRYDASGNPLSGEILVNQFTLNIQGNPAIAMDSNGDFVVAWESNYQDGDGYGIYARKYNASGNPITGEFQVNQVSTGAQQNAAVAIDSTGDFVVAWQGPDVNGYGVFARRYSATGTPLGGEFQVNQFATSDQLKPAVAMDSVGDFIMAWESHTQDFATVGVYGRRYDLMGAAQGNEFPINSYSPGDQFGPAIASAANGDVFVTWTSNGQDGSLGGIYGQRIAMSGQPLGGELQIHTTTQGDQTESAISCDSLGNSTVVWSATASPISGIISQRFGSPPVPQATISVDDGSPQRSNIRYLLLTFNTIVNVAPGAITLTGPLGDVALTSDYSASTATKTILRLTFTGPSATIVGLIDGRYTLFMSSAGITNLDGVAYDGNGDGTPGPDTTLHFHRLFGDGDGNALIDGIDYGLFRLQFATNYTQPQFKYYFDYDGDGYIGGLDFAGFRYYFTKTI